MSQIPKRVSLTVLVVLVCFLLSSAGTLSAQGLGGGPKKPAPTPRQQPKAPAGSGVVPKPKPTSTKDLDEARERIRERRERAGEESSAGSPPGQPPAPGGAAGAARAAQTPPPFKFEPFRKGDVRVLSTSWKTEERKGRKPFTVIAVKVQNLTGSWISVVDVTLTGQNATPLDPADARLLPDLPATLRRFSGAKGVPLPVKPRGVQTITFTLPCAFRSTSVLRAEVGECLRFRLERPVNWNPIRIVGFRAVPTSSGGQSHKGLFVTVENRADMAVEARLKIALDGLAPRNRGAWFHSGVALRTGERKTVILRTIPDESFPDNDPDRETRPADFRVRSVEISDMRF